MELKQVERKDVNVKIAIKGRAGTGKTYSALLMAYGMTGDWSKVAVIDTESGSANLYAHLGCYNIIKLDVYSPENYITAISMCEKAGIEVIVIDSISHCWENLLSCHAQMTGNSFMNWNKITPRYNTFIQKILNSSTHVICTLRTKQDYILSEKNGKLIPEKAGQKAIMREGIDYEFTIVMDISLEHKVDITKDRTGLFQSKTSFIPSIDTGEDILRWCTPDEKITTNRANNITQFSYGNNATSVISN